MDKITEFPIYLYGQVEKFNDVLSKERCRIFYRGGNRNGTYITDAFAEKLIASLPYTPIKGIYEEDDYTDHGNERSEGRIYGIVPENPNFAWEKHVDKDGVEREYACADVLLFTALYSEATEVLGKDLSMELYDKTLKYHNELIGGQRWIVFTEGCFLGLQILGEPVEPCFEGASFYSLQESIEKIIERIKEYSVGGQSEMPKFNFRLSDNQKAEAIWSLLNPDYTEEGGWVIDCVIYEVYEDYALVFNYATGEHERVYYVKNEDDTISLGERVKCFIVDVNETEKNTLDTLRRLNGETYELVSETLINAEANEQKCAELDSKIEEANSNLSTLQLEADEKNNELASAKETLNSLEVEVNELRSYKKNIETQAKKHVIEEYVGKLSTETLDTYSAKLDEYSIVDLDKELAYELKQTNISAFATTEPDFIPKDFEVGGIEEILAHYKK